MMCSMKVFNAYLAMSMSMRSRTSGRNNINVMRTRSVFLSESMIDETCTVKSTRFRCVMMTFVNDIRRNVTEVRL
jgi:hypothetical protein